jgi:hypothetical protein
VVKLANFDFLIFYDWFVILSRRFKNIVVEATILRGAICEILEPIHHRWVYVSRLKL